MYVKLHLDSACFHILCTTKTSPPDNVVGTSVSVSPLDNKPETIYKHRNQTPLQSSNVGGLRKFNGVHRRHEYDKPSVLVYEPELKKQSLEQNPDGDERENKWVESRIVNKSGKSRTDVSEKVHAKCSTKWANYGGCVPSMLQALDTIDDLDEAVELWVETLSNKERSIILKEQWSWERALEIFQWFKRKGCYELNVIHYNIILRILGKARQWSYVESLWEEMGVKRIALINSTYGTLIDVYSKGRRKEEAICWLERMKETGMEPDEVTMGIVVQMYKKAGEFRKAEEFFKEWSSRECLRCEGSSGSLNRVPLRCVLLWF